MKPLKLKFCSFPHVNGLNFALLLPIMKHIHSLIRWTQSRISKRQFLLLSAVLIGVSMGFASIVLKTFVHYIFKAATFNAGVNYNYYYLALPGIGILLTVLVIKYLLKGKLEKGLSNLHLNISKNASSVPREQMYSQIITSSITIGLGGSAGLEAPIVITGAAFGSNYAKVYHLTAKDRTLLLACGAAAGIGSAFNAPIAGVLFVLEVLLLDVSISAFIPLIIAAASGALISKIFLEENILLSFDHVQAFNYRNVPYYIMLGLLAGILSAYHSRLFTKVEGWFSKSKGKVYRNVIIGGLLLGLLYFVFPSLFGEGYSSIKTLSDQKPENLMNGSIFSEYENNAWYVLIFIGLTTFVKAFATGITLGAGGNGGNFAPSLFLGAHLGFFWARLVNLLNFTKLPENNFTIVGMAGILTGIYHAPLTAIFLIAEITGGYTLMIPLMIVSSIAFVISKYFEPYSMDTKKLVHSGQIFTDDKDKNILVSIKASGLVETDFQKIKADATLGSLVNLISSSRRNIFPVVDNDGKLLGIVLLDNAREVIFKRELYDTMKVAELMTKAPGMVHPMETMDVVMQKFDDTGAWNLPVIDDGKYIGFISKSTVFNRYREKLMATTL